MIRKVKSGLAIFSKTKGKRISKVFKTKKAAIKRLRQIEYFKHLKKR